MRRRHILVPLALTILASTALAAPAGAVTGSLGSLGPLEIGRASCRERV